MNFTIFIIIKFFYPILYMVIVRKERVDKLDIYYVDKNITNEEISHLSNTHINPSQIEFIISDDANVYDKNGELILLFRKKKLSLDKINLFYDNVKSFASSHFSTSRGMTSGGIKGKSTLKDNPRIKTNIIGYFNRFTPTQHKLIKTSGITFDLNIRQTHFMMKYPDKFERTLPLLQEINDLYKKYVPINYSLQKKKADETPFTIPNTAFTTATLNLNFCTTIHRDMGDDKEGFGNLAVIERGTYKGGETCFPQFGFGVDVRTGDILFMNVHQWHGNLSIEPENNEVQRLSIVAYLREIIWRKSRGVSTDLAEKHNEKLKNIIFHHTYTSDTSKTNL
jgi:hypothetical protein